MDIGNDVEDKAEIIKMLDQHFREMEAQMLSLTGAMNYNRELRAAVLAAKEQPDNAG